MKINFLLFHTTIFLLFSMCKAKDSSIQVLQEQTKSAERIVQIKRSPCFGTCPVDIIMVFSDGTVNYKGVQHTDYIGSFIGHISEDELSSLNELISTFYKAELLSSKYVMEHVMDLPSRVMTLEDRTITYQLSESPEAIINLDKFIYELLNRLELTKTEQSTKS